MTQFVFLAMMKNLLNGTKSVAAPTSLPTNVGAINCNQEGGLICTWWWGSVGWGLGLSCTPAGVNLKIGKGTTITITRLPEPPDISLSRCLFSFLCANPRPGTSAKNVEGVEDEIQVNQLTVDVDGRNPGIFSDTDYKDTARHHRFQLLHIVCEFSIPTNFAFCRNSAKYPAIKDAFDGSLYEFADPSIIYVSVDKDVGNLFWLADLNNEQVQNLRNHGVYLSNL